MVDTITFDDLQKVDIRVGTVKTVERIEDADKIYKLMVDFGDEQRQIVSGLVAHYSADELEGAQLPFILNLEPRTFKGVESQGMLLAVSDESNDGAPVLLLPDKDVPNGSEVI